MCKRKSDTLNKNPKVKKQHVISKYGEPIYQIELSKSWLMIITTNAERFYFHKPEEVSYWQIPNEGEDTIEANDKLEEMKDMTLLLVALIRGFVVANDAPDSVNSCIEKLKQLFKENDKNNAPEDGKNNAPEDDNLFAGSLQNDKTVVSTKPGGLIVGYYSSSENEDEEEIDMDDSKSEKEIEWKDAEEAEEGEKTEETEEAEDDEYGLNLSDLDDMLEISDTENGRNDEQEETIRELNLIYPEYKEKSLLLFLKMLDRKQPDSFSSYDLEVDELCKEPEFITVDDNNLRNELFDYWCKLKEKNTIKNDNLAEFNQVENKLDNLNENGQDVKSSPVMDFITYLNDQDKLPSFYVDFKRKNRKNKDFANLELPEKIKQSIYKRYVSFKKLGLDKKRKFLLDKISNLRQKETLSSKLDYIESGKYDRLLEFTFLIDNEDALLKEEIFKIIQNLL